MMPFTVIIKAYSKPFSQVRLGGEVPKRELENRRNYNS